MVESTIGATQAIVTLDVPIQGIVWGSIITVNMWAKSIGTGVVFLAAFIWFRHKKEDTPNLRWLMPVIAFLALNVFLLFTLIDLHQPYRMIHIFTHPHWTSSITVGAWLASIFLGLISILMIIGVADAFPSLGGKKCKITAMARNNSPIYERIMPFLVFLAIPVTTYTAIIMAQSSARELWQAPTEVMQMIWAALMAGSAALIFFSGSWSKEARKDLALVLTFSVFFSFAMYMSEYFFSFKSAEAEAVLAFVHSGGSYNLEFWVGMTLGFIIPFFLGMSYMKSENITLLKLAALLALVGLFFVKDVWLKIPQLLPLS
jgi:formate-dependent nitrite reductase membrane component NrfD